MKPEIFVDEATLPDEGRQVTMTVMTLAGVFEKRFTITKETLADQAAVERAMAFFKSQITTDLKKLRDQLNGWEL